jgi:predicted  nucleic acid-binding Zn-ribbon protein
VADDLTSVLTRFHRELVLPDLERVVGAAEQRLRDEMHSLFDSLAHRMGRLETEFEMLKLGFGRLEGRMDGVEGRLARIEEKVDRFALKSDLDTLKSRVADLQQQIQALEARLES